MVDYCTRPNIPGLGQLPPEVRTVVDPIKQLLEIHEGRRGNPYTDRFVKVGEIDAYVRTGVSAHSAFPTNSEAPDPPANVVVVASAWGNRISWTNTKDPDLWAVEVFCATVNDWTAASVVATVTIAPSARGGPSQWVHLPDGILADHYYWVRSVDYSGNASAISPGSETGGELAPGNDTVGQTIDQVLDALRAPNAPIYDNTAEYTSGQIMEYGSSLYQCYNGPVTGVAPDDPAGPDYWRMTGILEQGLVDGVNTVGINGRLVVEETIYGRSLVGGTVAANKLVVTDINAINLLNGPAEAGATNDAAWQAAGDVTKIDGGQIYAGSQIQIGNLDGVSDYCMIDSGDIEFYRYIDGEHRFSRSLKKVYSDIANSGDTVVLPGYWRSVPRIITSLSQIPSYNKDYSDLHQNISCHHGEVQEVSSGVYQFSVEGLLSLNVESSSETVETSDQQLFYDVLRVTTTKATYTDIGFVIFYCKLLVQSGGYSYTITTYFYVDGVVVDSVTHSGVTGEYSGAVIYFDRTIDISQAASADIKVGFKRTAGTGAAWSRWKSFYQQTSGTTLSADATIHYMAIGE